MNFRRSAIRGVAWLAAAFTLLGPAATLEAETPAPQTEARIKVAYIYNFLKFIEWPDAAWRAAGEPIRICEMGAGPLAAVLADLSARSVLDRPIEVVHLQGTEAFASCRVLFVGGREEARLAQLMQQVEGTPVLTVSDIPGFARRGGMIGFVTQQDRVKVEINQRPVRDAGLKVHAKLLEVARLVQ